MKVCKRCHKKIGVLGGFAEREEVGGHVVGDISNFHWKCEDSLDIEDILKPIKPPNKAQSNQKWVEVRRTFTPSSGRGFKVDGGSGDDLIMKLTYGFTTIELRNDRTGDIKLITSYGNQTKEGK